MGLERMRLWVRNGIAPRTWEAWYSPLLFVSQTQRGEGALWFTLCPLQPSPAADTGVFSLKPPLGVGVPERLTLPPAMIHQPRKSSSCSAFLAASGEPCWCCSGSCSLLLKWNAGSHSAALGFYWFLVQLHASHQEWALPWPSVLLTRSLPSHLTLTRILFFPPE